MSGVALAVSFPSNLKIMPLGDSITYGVGGTDGGYRGPLYKLLSKTAPGFQFVGASTWSPGSLPANMQQHNGYPSYCAPDISNNLDGLDTRVYDAFKGTDNYKYYNPYGGYWLTGEHGTGRNAVFPDVVLLQIGTNDIGGDLAHFQANLSTLVDKIVTQRPDANLIMAKITPYRNNNGPVTTINNAVNAVAAQYKKLGKHVSVVDLNTSFPSNGLSDEAHPNDVGYTWMANQWYGAIEKVYGVPEPGTFVLLITGLSGLLAYVWRNRNCH
jgi:hypothetical protein